MIIKRIAAYGAFDRIVPNEEKAYYKVECSHTLIDRLLLDIGIASILDTDTNQLKVFMTFANSDVPEIDKSYLQSVIKKLANAKTLNENKLIVDAYKMKTTFTPDQFSRKKAMSLLSEKIAKDDYIFLCKIKEPKDITLTPNMRLECFSLNFLAMLVNLSGLNLLRKRTRSGNKHIIFNKRLDKQTVIDLLKRIVSDEIDKNSILEIRE